jgi:hypothetical protein
MFFLIRWFAPYIPALKGRALRRFFGKGLWVRASNHEGLAQNFAKLGYCD